MSRSNRASVRLLRLLAIVVLSAALGPGIARAADPQPAAPPADADHQAIADAWSGYRAALVKGDAAAAAALFSEDGALMAPGLPDIEGRSTLEEFFAVGLAKAKVTDASFDSLQLDVYGDRAYQIGTYSQTAANPEGESQTSGGRYMAFWIKGADGRWRVHRLMVSRLPSPKKQEPESAPAPAPKQDTGAKSKG